jgi:hypothetical protein
MKEADLELMPSDAFVLKSSQEALIENQPWAGRKNPEQAERMRLRWSNPELRASMLAARRG